MINMGNDYGGTGWGGGTESTDRLKQIARDEIRNPQTPPRRKVFLSYRFRDKDKVSMLRGQAKNENTDLDFIDMGLKVPFNSENADYIKAGIRERIRQSSVTLVVVSDSTHESDWVNWEIRESVNQGKGVVVVDIRTNPSTPLPAAINETSGVQVVKWDHTEIMDAIHTAAKQRTE